MFATAADTNIDVIPLVFVITVGVLVVGYLISAVGRKRASNWEKECRSCGADSSIKFLTRGKGYHLACEVCGEKRSA